MILNKFFLDLNNKIYTNVELVLIDTCTSLKLDLHKNILGFSSDFFHNLFNFNFENKSQYEIIVDDIKIAHDIILSFYEPCPCAQVLQKINSTDYPEWKYILKTIKCRNYFALDNDATLLYDLVVPKEGFELLVEVIDLFYFVNNEKLLNTIKRNIPNDYDLTNFSNDFIKKLVTIKNYYIVSGSSDNSIKVWDAITGQLLNTLIEHTSNVISVAFSNNIYDEFDKKLTNYINNYA